MTPWSVIIPVKPAELGKSRLRGAVPGVSHASLARALALDTISAVLSCGVVRGVVVVTTDSVIGVEAGRLGAVVVPDPVNASLNSAVRYGASLVTGPVAAVTADLPALRVGELGEALGLASGYSQAFVADFTGTGTVMVSSLGGLEPLFGVGSAAAHAGAGFVALDGEWPSLRLDVDTPGDLEGATRLGLGYRSAALVVAAAR